MYEALKERFAEVFGAAPTLLFSAPAGPNSAATTRTISAG